MGIRRESRINPAVFIAIFFPCIYLISTWWMNTSIKGLFLVYSVDGLRCCCITSVKYPTEGDWYNFINSPSFRVNCYFFDTLYLLPWPQRFFFSPLTALQLLVSASLFALSFVNKKFQEKPLGPRYIFVANYKKWKKHKVNSNQKTTYLQMNINI